ncbi:MAG: COG1361 S-layer family protein, partial [Cecembia sp.]
MPTVNRMLCFALRKYLQKFFALFFLLANLLVVTYPFTELRAQAGKDGNLTVSAANTVVNTYAPVVVGVSSGDLVVVVNNIASLGGLGNGDLIMVYQAQGAEINTSNSVNYGEILDYRSAGLYEFVRVQSVAGNTIRLECGLSNDYQVTGFTQVVKVPQYNILTINAGASIVPTAWGDVAGGRAGGIVAIMAEEITLNGTINASERGFRGGRIFNGSLASGATQWADYRSTDVNYGGEKGESIAGNFVQYDLLNGRNGRGAPANGGGGGNSHNAGGGGGANGNNGNLWNGQGVMCTTCLGAAAWQLDPGYIANGNTFTTSSGGGRGGYVFSSANRDALTEGPGLAVWGGNRRFEVGGLGGRPLASDPEQRIFFGGGGGAGDGNNNAHTDGGHGGGMIYIMTNALSGSGSMISNGQTAANTRPGHNDAPGGGGAGGTIIVKAESIAASLGFQANGGNGGNQLITNNEAEGPGGGGGGGFIARSIGAGTAVVGGGTNGITTSTALTEFPTNGATSGATGQLSSVTEDFNIIGPCADLEITKSVNNATPNVGDNVIFTVTVTNNGPSNSPDVVVSDLLPSGYTFVSATTTQGAYNSANGLWAVGTINDGSSQTLTITATVNFVGNYLNTATVFAGTVPDPDLSNNVATAAIDPVCPVNPGQNTITGLVFDDLNINGLLDAAEPGLESYVVQLFEDLNNNGVVDGGEPLVATTTSGSNGIFTFVVDPNQENVRDEFNTNGSPAGSNGSIPWAANWVEVGESDGFGAGQVRVANNRLEIRNLDREARRTVDLSGASLAVLSFDFQGVQINQANRRGIVEISESSTGPWTQIATIENNTASSTEIDISSFISSNTTIRFRNDGNVANNNRGINIDNVNIEIFYPTNYLVRLETPLPPDVVQTSAPIEFPVTFTSVDEADCDVNFGLWLPRSDIEVVKTVNNLTPDIFSQVTFQISVENLGPNPTTGVTVTDLIPSGFTFVNGNPSQGTYNHVTGIWDVGALTVNQVEMLEITAVVNASGDYTNTATGTSDLEDLNLGNNTSSVTVSPVLVPVADLSVTKVVNDPTPNVGGTVIFTVTVANAGPDPATGVLVNDLLPNGFSFVNASTSSGSYNSGTGIWNVGNIAVGGSETLEITVTVNEPAAGISYTNTATIASSDQADSDITNNEDSATVVPVVITGISLDKTADPLSYSAVGEVITYTFTVQNTGNVTLSDVSISDPLTGLSAISPVSIASLAPGATEIFTATYTITQTDIDNGSVTNTATVNAEDPNGAAISDTDSETITAAQTATISLSKSASPGTYSVVGEVITYTFTVQNTGNVTLSDVSISDPLTGLSAISPATIASLAPGATEIFTATYTITQADIDNGSVANTATVNAEDPNGAAISDTNSETINAAQTATLTLDKSASSATYSAVGEVITYTFTVENTGNVTLTDVSISDPLTGLSAISPVSIASLAPGATETFTATYTITQADIDNGSVANSATVNAEDPSGD